MGRLIFVDVGTHDGQTLAEVAKSKYGFDTIIGLEPHPQNFQNAVESFRDDPRILIYNFGLSDSSGKATLYGDSSNLGASIFSEKVRPETDTNRTLVDLVRASDFFQEMFTKDDTVIVKLNCEGAEVPILRDLIKSGQIHGIKAVMIDFDIRHVRGAEHLEMVVLEELQSSGFSNFSLAEKVMIGKTHQHRIAHWLRGTRLTAARRNLVLDLWEQSVWTARRLKRVLVA